MRKLNPKIIYSPYYDIHFYGLEKLHPFDSRKYSRAWGVLKKKFGQALKQWHIKPTHPIDVPDLLTVHTEAYLKKLKSRSYLTQALEFPPVLFLPMFLIEKRLLQPMRLATMGTVMAAKEALKGGLAINLSGGYHHASQERGEGFTLYSDVGIAVAKLRQSGHLIKGKDKILIIDLDVHQSNGPERVFYNDEDVIIFDMYNQDIYPQDYYAEKRIDYNIPFSSGIGDVPYLNKLRQNLKQALAELPPISLAFYIAGTDIYEHDPLGRIKISQQGIFERDKFVFDSLTTANIPWVMVLGGGYHQNSYQLIANSICYIFETFANEK